MAERIDPTTARGFNLPYQPIRQELYTPAELFRGFVRDDASCWTRTVDFMIYRHFVAEGRAVPRNPYMGMMQALHDNAIVQATAAFLAERKVAAIMGGHQLPRDAPAYRDAAILARTLTRTGILVCTGGGPGAMEASHLGASLAGADDAALDDALNVLAKQPQLPDLGVIVDPTGAVDAELAARAHAWFEPAHTVAASIENPRESLGVPTWQIGHEPSTPFATRIAKYFQNSIREDGLLALATQGVVYVEGKAGTIQEIFQDGAQNYYKSFGQFSPMVLLGVDYWTTKYPVVALLRQLFAPDDFARCVKVTDDVEIAARFVAEFDPSRK